MLSALTITRHVLPNSPGRVEPHAFCDASQLGYGSCVYIRSVNKFGEVSVNMLCAKGRVAPLKSLLIRKLELCGALILSRLIVQVIKSLEISYDRCVLWTDSTIVLG